MQSSTSSPSGPLTAGATHPEMEETAESRRQSTFHPAGAGVEHSAPVDSAVRPALLAPYRDLASLRYDFPVVLVEGAVGGEFVRSLSAAVDELLQDVAPRGNEGERVRRRVLRAEQDIRVLVADGARGLLSDLWERAAPDLVELRTHLNADGEVVDCDHGLPRRLVEHAWRTVQRRKSERFHVEVNGLIQSLSDILRAAFIHSQEGRRPESLRAAFGAPHHDQFDFDTMSRLLQRGASRDELPPDRCERIEWALAVLRRQRFFEAAAGSELTDAAEPPFDHRYGSCAEALDAFRDRLPQVVEFVKAMSIAALEAEGRYVASEHDAFFDGFDAESLGREDLALFPDYLVCAGIGESAAVMELLSSDMPVKVLVETEDCLDLGGFGFATRGTQLASTVVGLVDVFALQTTSSNLYQLRERLLAGLDCAGPTLISVYSGAATPPSGLPPYLTSAAALEARAFPTFTYDPAAGPHFASRFSVIENPQPELDWPLAQFAYADASHQRVVEQVAFTLADFAVCDQRYARHFARIPREDWTDRVIPVADWLALDPADSDAHIPYILVVGDGDSLQRLAVDAKLMQATRRCREVWHSLQELGHEGALAETSAPVVEEPTELVQDPVLDPRDEAAPEGPAPAEPATDEPWIETPRCSTCNECTAINDHMFAYNENKQAYIKDPASGTFRELVEAAEACQVAVIHPGKPRDPTEPGLEELVERARAFE